MRRWRLSRRLALGLSSLAVYTVLFAVLYPLTGTALAALSAVPVSLLGWAFGSRIGLLASLVTVSLNACLLVLLPYAGGLPAIARSLPGSLLILLIGPLSGWLSDLMAQVREQSLSLKSERDLLKQEMAERQRTEHALRESEARLELIFGQIPAVVWTTDRALRFTSVMGGALAGLETPPEGYLGRALEEIFSVADSAGPALAAHEQALSGSPVTFELEHHEHVFQARVEPFLDGNGRIVGCVGIAVDISPRKHMEREREQLIQSLQEAIINVKTLSGLLPICTSCKKIRDDRGYWNQIETYLRRHSQATFTHALCPECTRQHYPDLYLSDHDETAELSDSLLLLPMELNQRADLVGSALSTWLRLRQSDLAMLAQFLGCDGQTLERLAKVPRPSPGRYHDADVELIAVSLGIEPLLLKRLLADVEQAEGQ